jgi:hypothetical protein
MPATPSQLRRAIVIGHTVDFGDGVQVTFRYDRNKITDAWVKQWTEFENQQDVGAMNEVLADLISGWDIQNDDGSPYPVSAESIGFLFSYPDKIKVLQELMTAPLPTAEEKKGSSGPTNTPSSDSTEQAPNSPNGSETSSSPLPSTAPSPM